MFLFKKENNISVTQIRKIPNEANPHAQCVYRRPQSLRIVYSCLGKYWTPVVMKCEHENWMWWVVSQSTVVYNRSALSSIVYRLLNKSNRANSLDADCHVWTNRTGKRIICWPVKIIWMGKLERFKEKGIRRLSLLPTRRRRDELSFWVFFRGNYE